MKNILKILIIFFILTGNLYGITIDGNIITDNKGRKLKVVKNFSRIISLYGAHTENLLYLGAKKNIIGVSKHDNLDSLRKSGVKKFSYRDDVEKFLAAKPDLVIIRPMIDRSYKGLIKRLSQFTTVISLQPVFIDDMFTYWKALGLLTGKNKKAGSMTENFKKAVKAFQSLKTGKKKVYFEAIHSKMKTFNKDSMAMFVLEKAGGINIAKDAMQVRKTNIASYGKERILSKAPFIDAYLAQKGVMNRTSVSVIKNEPGFALIKAVRENKIYIIDEKIVSRPTMRLLEGIYKTGVFLYPDVYNNQGRKIFERYMR